MNTACESVPSSGLKGLTPIANGAATPSEAVVFESRGCVLVLADDVSAGYVAQRVAQHFTTVVFAPGVDVRDWGSRVTSVGRKVTHLHGYLGAFQASIHSVDEVTDIGAASPNPGGLFDLVLDLSAQPLITDEVKPYGYFSPGADEPQLAQAFAAMQALVGRFSKPRYFNYSAQLCAHGASSVKGCSRCLDVCSTRAISSSGHRITVNPHLCQGCATCTLSCPTGALSFKVPDRQTLTDRLQTVLAQAGKGVTLVVYEHDSDALTQMVTANPKVVLFQVEPLPAFGDELWLRALALGASALVLVDDSDLPAKARALIEECVAQTQLVLTALHFNADCVTFLKTDALAGWLELHASVSHATQSAIQVAPLKSWDKFKRLAWVDALRQLDGTPPAQSQTLSVGASFGALQIDPKRCSLCFACVNLCPTRALNARGESLQQLMFQESACVQCGLCVNACPEHALALQPRVAPLTLARMTSVVLHQDALLPCTSCGVPFISGKMLASSWNMLKDHPVLAKGGRAALMTCPNCRQQEMLDN